MKMLLIVFRQSMVEQIHALLKEYDVNAFTELHNVAGRGDRTQRSVLPVTGPQLHDPHSGIRTACLPPHRWVHALESGRRDTTTRQYLPSSCIPSPL
jgi:hypothetical protein